MIDLYLTKNAITLKTSGGTDTFNEPLPTTDTAVDARVIWKTRMVRDVHGEQVVSSAEVWIKNRTPFPTHADKVALDGVDRDILAVSKSDDFNAVFLKVFLK